MSVSSPGPPQHESGYEARHETPGATPSDDPEGQGAPQDSAISGSAGDIAETQGDDDTSGGLREH